MKYNVDDIRVLGGDVLEVEAKSPLEAVRKAFPGYKVTRDYSNTGDIVVGRCVSGLLGRGGGYRTYVYRIEKENS